MGYKSDYEMYSMDFEEFLWGKGYDERFIEEMLEHMRTLKPFNEVQLSVCSALFLDYCILGGMPAVVREFIDKGTFEGSLEVQRQLVADYKEDIRKYADGLDQTRILNVFQHIPVQLAKENKKFQISKVASGARFRDYRGCIEWLSDAGMVNVCHCLHFPELPLKGNYDETKYKLYFADTGLLVAMLDEEAQDDLRANKNLGVYKGALYENIVGEALVKAGYPNIPVASLNFSGLEKDSGFQMTLPLARRAIASVFYGDMLCALRNQVAPYENEKGAADKMVDLWVERLGRVLLAGKGFTSREMKHTFPLIAKDFKSIPVTRVPKVKVGVVGEIYVKYSPLGNNDLQKFLESQDCEVNFPGLMGFVQYCIFNMGEDHVLYGGKLAMKMGTDQLLNWLDSVERSMLKAEADAGFYAPGPFKELVEKPEGIISLGAKMGEGWLLTAEMIELVQGGYGNIVCAQPFGCLPNHIVGKGMVNKIRAMYPSANITPIDYDPSATKVNQENRIKLMLAVAKERLNAPAEAKPLTAEEIAGGAPSLSHV